MKNIYKFLLFGLFLMTLTFSNAQTFWDGEKITFTKAANADWTLPENQDQITDAVHITRKDQWPIFNIVEEDINSTDFDFCSTWLGPQDTEWAFGTIADGVENLTFDGFLGVNFTNCGPGGDGVNPVDMDAVLHLISEDIYIDIKFLSWGMGMNGGGSFSYERATQPIVSTDELENEKSISLFPNPAQKSLSIEGLDTFRPMDYSIYNAAGVLVKSGVSSANETIDIESLPLGIYVFRVDEYNQALKFVKH